MTITVHPDSTIIITANFKNEADEPVIPNEVTWTLKDGSGNIVNGREDVVVSAASEVSIILSGDDLTDSDESERILTVNGNYYSDLSPGNALDIADEITFYVGKRKR